MRIVVTAQGAGFDAMSSPILGRCPTFAFVDTETMACETVRNPAVAAGGGAGVRAAQSVVDRQVGVVLSRNLGPNAYGVLHMAGVEAYRIDGGMVREAVEAFMAGKLPRLDSPSVGAHSGMGRRV